MAEERRQVVRVEVNVTTTRELIGKLDAALAQEGKQVLLEAEDVQRLRTILARLAQEGP